MKKHLLFAGCSVFLGGVLFFGGNLFAAGHGGGGHGGGGHGGGGGHMGGGHMGGGHVGGGHMGGGAMHHSGGFSGGNFSGGNFGGAHMHHSGGVQLGSRSMGGGGGIQLGHPQRNALPSGGLQHQHQHLGGNLNNPGVTVHRPNLNGIGNGLQQNHLPGMHHNVNPSLQHFHNGGLQGGGNSLRIGGNHYHPSYQNYSWHHGHWHNYGRGGIGIGLGYGGWGLGYGYGYGLGYPLGWGYGGWGLGRNYYRSGYLSYYNPYCLPTTGVSVYNYTQPIPVVVNGNNAAQGIAAQNFDSARQLFMGGDYAAALSLVDQSIKDQPSDAVLHEFRSLVLFAMGDYDNSAATIHSVLSVGPGWDWSTMIGLYPNPDVYTGQLRALEKHVAASPNQASGRFLLGYHYITTGNLTAAAYELKQVTALVPNDRTAADLLRTISPSNSTTATPPDAAASAPTLAQPEVKLPPISMEAVGGDWKASRTDGSAFELNLMKDKTFTWKFVKDGKADEFGGTYSTEGSLLILQSKDGSVMVGQISAASADGFNFKLVGAPSDDPGLSFKH
ncbi:MAG: tetratricopeptide repeat protein [Planctomycetaceae bacterium]